MTVTALMVFIVISQMCMGAYLLYSFNEVEREARKRNADMRAHFDRVVASLESRLSDSAPQPVIPPVSEPVPRRQAVG